MPITRSLLPATLVLLSLGFNAHAEPNTPDSEAIDPLVYVLPEDKSELFELAWEDLLPPGEDERIATLYQTKMQELFSGGTILEGSMGDVAIQIGTHNTVSVLDGQNVKIPGYPVPIEFGDNTKIKEFLLVPYFGACLHAPPPPPNQTLYVVSEKPIKLKDIRNPIWVEGYIRTQSEYNDLAESAYTIELKKFRPYD